MNLSEEDLIDTCVQCGKRQNAASNLTEQVFQVNTANKCGHKFCSSCIERELYKKRQFACPRCKNMVARDKLSKKSLDETEVERDYSIRRKITALYNKKETDFATMEEFKNYEEMVEDIIYNLVNLIDVDGTNQLIEKYKQDNSKEITINQFRRKEELKGELISIKEREEAIVAANQKFQESLQTQRAQKLEDKRQLNQLMLGDTDPSLTQAVVSRLLGNTSSSATSTAGAAAPSSAPVAPSAAIPNPVLRFLNSREEPKAVTIKSESSSAHSNVDIRKMHQAGGYDFGSYEQRNWTEILLHTRNQKACT